MGAHSNSIDFYMAMNCTNIYTFIRHTHTARNKDGVRSFCHHLLLFLVWSGVIKQIKDETH